jgi:hypothetical protein
MKHLNEEGNYEFGIYEVYYDDNGKVVGWTAESLTPVFESEKVLQEELNNMMQAFKEETLLHECNRIKH